ncbi:MAG: radical SAM protein [Anaerolineae bacterium]|nr:radical SAM protein [Anaerolineae bacterium]
MKWDQIQEARNVLSKESGVTFKDWGGRIPIALAYANTYYVGMSSLALQVIYRAFNAHPDVVCERVFWNPRRRSEPLISLESQNRVADFAVWAFTISYEMDYFNLITMLRQAGMPPLAADRDESWPLVIGGGPALSANPEPVALFFDAIVIGEGEEIIGSLVDVLRAHAGDKAAILAALDKLPGFYVPALRNTSNGPPPSPSPVPFTGEGRVGAGGSPIHRLWVRDLTRLPTVSSLVTRDTEFGDLYLMEIARGCGRGCRFCLAGYVYRPPREVPLDVLLEWARAGLQHRPKIGLVSAAVSDHSQIDELAVRLREMGAKISVSSMRVDPISVPLVKALAESGTQTLTIAPEAGSVRLRDVINKPQTEEQLLDAVALAESLKFPQLKMYFMVGHPTETEEDIRAMVELALAARQRFKRRLVLNTTPYVPKPHTPFQWEAMTPAEVVKARQEYVKKALSPHQVAVRADSPQWAEVQGVLARGDRRLAYVLLSMREELSLPAWERALADAGLTADEYLSARTPGEPLPWDIVESGVTDAFFRYELRHAHQHDPTPGCPPQAQGCLKCQACDSEWAFRAQPAGGRLSMPISLLEPSLAS